PWPETAAGTDGGLLGTDSWMLAVLVGLPWRHLPRRAGRGTRGADGAVLQADLQGALQHRLALFILLFLNHLHSWRLQTHQLLQHHLIGAFFQCLMFVSD
uniref:Uncharacterized protein n=1 Tax=Seriola lalandi dorsalis TaxID=1841481 RepID=A0A3B4XL21_SERLL